MMGLIRKLQGLLRSTVMSGYERYQEAEKQTDEVVELARELKHKLEPFEREPDPFRSLMISLYNRRAELIQSGKVPARVR